MQIDPTHLTKASAAAIQQAAPAPAEAPEAAATQSAGAVTHTDQIALSQQATEVQAAHVALAQTPEVRAELVANLKAQVAEGTYRVDADKVADALLNQ